MDWLAWIGLTALGVILVLGIVYALDTTERREARRRNQARPWRRSR